jgi:transcriptional regulator with XRE-family HTH domain
MNGTADLGTALRRWRDRTSPTGLELPAGQVVRRTAGLRREELALLAGISVDYLVRLEQGRATAPSAPVLSALARALRLSPAECDHLYQLAGQPPPSPEQISAEVPARVRQLLERLEPTAMGVYDDAWNLVEWNRTWAGLLGDPSSHPERERNLAWRHFTGMPTRVNRSLEQRTRFETAMVSDLRSASARYRTDAALASLIEQLHGASLDFARLWDSGVVGSHESDVKDVHHPDVGMISLDCDVLAIPGGNLHIVIFTAAPGSDAQASSNVSVPSAARARSTTVGVRSDATNEPTRLCEG